MFSTSVKKTNISILSTFFFASCALGIDEWKTNQNETQPPHVGNFALPSSQQPGVLMSFGENIIDKNQLQLLLFADDIIGSDKHNMDAIPNLLYGLTDNFSLNINIPIAVSFKNGNNHSSGLEDMFFQPEYAFYVQQTSKFVDQATIVGNITFPTGSNQKQPNTGFGSISYFLGATFNRTYSDWIYFTSHGVVLTTSDDSIKFGDQFLYQFGIGRNIAYNPLSWIFSWLLEANGQYNQKDKIDGVINPNSGGNTILLTPSLWFSTPKLAFQLGVGFPIAQHLFGDQIKTNYLLAGNFGWTIK